MPSSARFPLTRERILRAALSLIDEAGLEALSMRKLGASLGVEAMSLYNHVVSKEDLLCGVADLLLETASFPERSENWLEDIHGLCVAVRRIGLEHPNAFSLLVTEPRISDEAWRPVLVGFSLFEELGLSPADAAIVTEAVTSFVIGFVLFEINGYAGTSAASGDGAAKPGRKKLRGAVPLAQTVMPDGRADQRTRGDAESNGEAGGAERRVIGRFLAAQRERSADESFRRGVELVLGGLRAEMASAGSA